MLHSGSPAELAGPLVGDASFWINIVATMKGKLLLEALGRDTVITDVALQELERGRSKGRAAADEVNALARRNVIQVVQCAAEDEDLLLSLIVGSAPDTLDDGEAATLVYTARAGGAAVIDERKATALAAARFPKLRVLSTVDLLLDPRVSAEIGIGVVADAIFNALMGARMRVPPGRLTDVAELLGADRLATCQSIPNRVRRGEGQASARSSRRRRR